MDNNEIKEVLKTIVKQASEVAEQSLDSTISKVLEIAKRHGLSRPLFGVHPSVLIYLLDFYKTVENNSANQILEEFLGERGYNTTIGGGKIVMESDGEGAGNPNL